MKLNDKVALVTGASRGIGRAIASALAAEGASLLLNALHEEGLKKLADEIRSSGKAAYYCAADISTPQGVQCVVREAEDRFGRVDILVNNAGLGIFANIIDLSLEDWELQVGTNLTGPFLLSKALAPGMIERKSGTIVNIASLAGKNFFAGGTAYCASKWGLLGLTGCLMQELRKYDIKVVAICPGSVNTGFSSKEGVPDEKRARMLQVEDVADAVIYAVTSPPHANPSEIDLRPNNPMK